MKPGHACMDACAFTRIHGCMRIHTHTWMHAFKLSPLFHILFTRIQVDRQTDSPTDKYACIHTQVAMAAKMKPGHASKFADLFAGTVGVA